MLAQQQVERIAPAFHLNRRPAILCLHRDYLAVAPWGSRLPHGTLGREDLDGGADLVRFLRHHDSLTCRHPGAACTTRSATTLAREFSVRSSMIGLWPMTGRAIDPR